MKASCIAAINDGREVRRFLKCTGARAFIDHNLKVGFLLPIFQLYWGIFLRFT